MHRTLIVLKPLGIGFDKTDGLIKVYDDTRYLVLFLPEKHDAIYNRIRYLISRKMRYFICYFSKLSKNKSFFISFFASRESSDFA